MTQSGFEETKFFFPTLIVTYTTESFAGSNFAEFTPQTSAKNPARNPATVEVVKESEEKGLWQRTEQGCGRPKGFEASGFSQPCG